MRTVLITGASRGIGREAASEFLRAGYNVIANYNETLISSDDFPGFENHVLCVKADVSSYSEVVSMFLAAKMEFGMVDVVINNAAVAREGLLTEMTEESWDLVMDINLKGIFNVCRCAIPDMLSIKKGRIINISSMWGLTGASCEVAYSASKAGVIGFTKALAKELAISGIYVNCIAPGIIDTDMNKNYDTEMLLDMIPVGRMGVPKDITDMMLLLANESTSFITGQVFSVNGGTVI
jgi:3-oxoacyl-[acyl-carrier protein] reductase